jgi:hypothetical protein
MAIAVSIIAAIARLLFGIGQTGDAAENQDTDYDGCGLGWRRNPVHAHRISSSH